MEIKAFLQLNTSIYRISMRKSLDGVCLTYLVDEYKESICLVSAIETFVVIIADSKQILRHHVHNTMQFDHTKCLN